MITKTDHLAMPLIFLHKRNHKYTTKKGTTILAIWPVSYFLASDLTRFLEKHLEVDVTSASKVYYKDVQFGSTLISAAEYCTRSTSTVWQSSVTQILDLER